MTVMVFIHGWGQSQQIWYEQKKLFPHASYLNLPGHGGAEDSNNWLETLVAQLPEKPCALIGWSLGGMLSMQLALAYPKRIKALFLLSSTPCFRQREGWSYGCSDDVLQGFELGINKQASKTMARFFALMLHGENIDPRRHHAIARAAVDRSHPTTDKAMQEGLALLATLDLRAQLASISQPTWVLHGEKDAVIPVQAGDFLTQYIPHATQYYFQNCGHAPFLTQAKSFHCLLESWCQTI